MFHGFANPARFNRLARAAFPWSLAVMLLCLGVGLPWALVFSPADYQQGDSVRIMYVHVPAAWMAMFVYASMALAAAVGDRLPCVVAKVAGELTRLLEPDELEACRSSVEELERRLQRRAQGRGLEFPGLEERDGP